MDESKRTRDQSYQRALSRIDSIDTVRYNTALLLGMSEEFFNRDHEGIFVTDLERVTEKGRPIVRVRLEDRLPPDWRPPWRVATFKLVPDDLYVAESVRLEGVSWSQGTQQSDFEYDHQDGIPLLRAAHTTTNASDGSHGTIEMTITDRQFGPVPEEDFDPERFLDGPQVREAAEPEPFANPPNRLMQWSWLPIAVGAICLLAGAGLRIATWHRSHPFGRARVS